MSNNDLTERAKMVNWYSPSQLKDTAIKTMISTIISENADPRLITAASDKAFFDYKHELTQNGFDFTANEIENSEIWID